MIKFDIELISIDNESISIKYSSSNEVHLITTRLHVLPYENLKPENHYYREDKIINEKNIIMPLSKSNSTGVTFVVIDKTHEEQYSIGIDFKSKNINIEKMFYEG